jgi:AcrR family transcriptional regulator
MTLPTASPESKHLLAAGRITVVPVAATDETVFDATLAVLAERGYAGATTRGIAKAAGINEVTLFRRYGDKRGLILAAIHADMQRLAKVGLEPSGDIEGDLVRVVGYYAGLYQHRKGLVATLVLEGSRDPEVAALISEPLAAVSRLGELVAHYQGTGELAEGPTDYVVQALLAPLLMSSVVRRIADSDGALPDPQWVVRRFLAGHRSGPGL